MVTGAALNPGERLNSEEEGINPAKYTTLPDSKGCGCGPEQARERLSSEPIFRNLTSQVFTADIFGQKYL